MLKLAYLQRDIQKILWGILSVSELLLSYQLILRSFRWLIKFWPILNSCINRLLVLVNPFTASYRVSLGSLKLRTVVQFVQFTVEDLSREGLSAFH